MNGMSEFENQLLSQLGRITDALETIGAVLAEPWPEPWEPEPDPPVVDPDPPTTQRPAWDFDDVVNPCWAYTSEYDWVRELPIGDTPVVPIRVGGKDFATNLRGTLDAASGRVIVQLEEGVYELTSFVQYGQDIKYSFAFFHPKLAGLLGKGPDKTFVQLRANSMTPELIASIEQMKYAAEGGWKTLQTGVIRMDGTEDSPVCIGGITFRSADQQDITAIDPSFGKVGVKVPQPAPHRGLQIYQRGYASLSHVRFQAFGRAITSAPPFECPSLNSQLGHITLNRVEIDGRRSAVFDPARPRRAGIYLMNDEYLCDIQWSHFHHSNVSRYAVNDENHNTKGLYTFHAGKIEHIADTRNDGLGGAADACCMGWESCAGTIVVTDSILSMDNTHTGGSYRPMHLQLANPGGKDRTGGSLKITRTEFRSPGLPGLDGWVMLRVGTKTQWYTEGIGNRVEILHQKTGERLFPCTVKSWPPAPAALEQAGVSSDTHYLVWVG